jgi:asparagine synthase (glutamine-hydrolysing)
MCGIAGLVNWGDEESLARMTDLQVHRGPDDRGVWYTELPGGESVGLGSRRLAILDLSPAGHMPMSNPEGTVWITYNGETYNFPELRSELECKGYRFRSRSDTETILNLYLDKGKKCVHDLNGMFAFAICDLRHNDPHLFLARDHFGIKPLYYCHQGRKFAFASEVKALLVLPDCPRELDFDALHQYLTFLWVPDPRTMFKGIFKLPAGHSAVFRKGILEITRYWDLSFPKAGHRFSITEEDAAKEVRNRFTKAVKRQMISDVPVGAFLSAGLDSSSIVAAMANSTSEPVRTYTITFPPKYRMGEDTLDDPAVAARTAEGLGCLHTQITVEPDVAGLLPKLVYHMDEPTADPAIIAAYLVNKEARKSVTVLLSGVGGDEVFAGYRKYEANLMGIRYRRMPGWLRTKVIDPALRSVPPMRGTRFRTVSRFARKWGKSASLDPRLQMVMDATYLDAEEKEMLYLPGVQDRAEGFDPSVRHMDCFETVKDADWLNQLLYLDTKIFMPTLNLTYNDKMSMAVSTEVRVPFLDKDLVEWVAWNVPPAWKLKGREKKYIFRKAMAGMLPPEVLRQKKASFGAPVDYWLANDLREMVDDLLDETRIRRRGLFRPDTVRRWVHEQREGSRDCSMQIWQLLTLELWMQTFLDRR